MLERRKGCALRPLLSAGVVGEATVSLVARALPNTLRGLEADAAVISTYLKIVSGPVVLVGHSYGGSVISVAFCECFEREGISIRGCLRSRSR